MFAAGTREASPDPLLRLVEFLRSTGSAVDPAEAAKLAIDDWIAAQAEPPARPSARQERQAVSEFRGYQWKAVFLPNGSELRMHYGGREHYAQVTGDDIIYAGQRVSPRQMTLAIAGDGRNAWHELWIRLPDEKKWKLASILRREIAQQAAPKVLTPQEAMMAAAACMADTLKSALALVDHARNQTINKYERRLGRLRREADVMVNDCLND